MLPRDATSNDGRILADDEHEVIIDDENEIPCSEDVTVYTTDGKPHCTDEDPKDVHAQPQSTFDMSSSLETTMNTDNRAESGEFESFRVKDNGSSIEQKNNVKIT